MTVYKSKNNVLCALDYWLRSTWMLWFIVKISLRNMFRKGFALLAKCLVLIFAFSFPSTIVTADAISLRLLSRRNKQPSELLSKTFSKIWAIVKEILGKTFDTEVQLLPISCCGHFLTKIKVFVFLSLFCRYTEDTLKTLFFLDFSACSESFVDVSGEAV